MEWYYAKNGKQEGPVSAESLQGMIVSGAVAPTDLIWREGMAEWIPAGQVAEFSGGGMVAPPGGSQIPQGGVPQPGQVPGAPVAHAPIPNYLAQSILVTVLCCMPFGIPAIIFSSKVDGMVARGDIAGALEASKKAKTWSWVSFGCGIAAIPVFFLIGFASEM